MIYLKMISYLKILFLLLLSVAPHTLILGDEEVDDFDDDGIHKHYNLFYYVSDEFVCNKYYVL